MSGSLNTAVIVKILKKGLEQYETLTGYEQTKIAVSCGVKPSFLRKILEQTPLTAKNILSLQKVIKPENTVVPF